MRAEGIGSERLKIMNATTSTPLMNEHFREREIM